MAVLRATYLEYKQGNSDKLYNVILETESPIDYVVYAEYGRRGSVLKRIEKYRSFSEGYALAEYRDLIADKESKGYAHRNITTTTQGLTKAKPKTKPKAVSQVEQNIAEGIRRIDFEL